MSELMIKIPDEFNIKLKGTEWQVIVEQTILNAQPFLNESPKFFPEYTRHGNDHVNHVVENIQHLIPGDVLSNDELLKAEDVGKLLCAVIIHDLGMFIDNSQFFNLIHAKYKIDGILDDRGNIGLWEDYCYKAERFSTEKWTNLAGITNGKIPIISKDFGEWTVRDHLIIGEFLRWYHHLFAYEIALYGFMGTDILPKQLSERSRHLIGLTAYSHCIGIRDLELEEYCTKYFGESEYVDNSPLYYFIAALRLADYLDTGVERAPKTLKDVHIFLSETSRKEWVLNQQFRYESFGWRKAKRTRTLDLPATPDSTTEFVSTEKMLLDLQREFDSSIAVTEEKYHGQYPFTISRITSNILKSKSRSSFAEKFFLNETRLSASSNILPLLVGPLYANHPSYGVRELLQNAVDACRQRESFEPEYEGKIEIAIDTYKKTFLIKDNGIGMNEDIITNYYLKAGSSYRNSEEWRKDCIDGQGKPTVIRIGRFGIGALASFLIGHKTSIMTRRIGEQLGCSFSYTLDADRSIDVTCCRDIETGTTISIEMSDKSCLYFRNNGNTKQWSQWYRYKSPEVEIILDGEKIEPPDIVPSVLIDNSCWYRFNSKIYSDFIWSYECHFENALICNGIAAGKIEPHYHQYKDHWTNTHWSIIHGYGFAMHLPCIALNDYEGFIKFDLARRAVEDFPLESAFIEEVYKYLIAELLCSSYFSEKPHIWESRHGYIPMAHSDNGYTVLARSFILHTGVPVWCFTNSRYLSHPGIAIGFMNEFDDTIHYNTGQGEFNKMFVNGELLAERSQYKSCCGAVVYMEKNSHFAVNKIDLSEYFGASCKDTFLLNQNIADFDENTLNEIVTLASCLENDGEKFVQYFPSPVQEKEKNLMLKVLQTYIPTERNGGWIPYELEARKQMYPEAFQELSGYMDAYRSY